MTANDMKFAWQLEFDALFEFQSPAYDDRQISYLLTQAQWRVFLKRYNPFGNKYQKGFEADEQRRRDLEQLIEPISLVGVGTTGNIIYEATWDTGDKTITIVDGDTSNAIKTTAGLVKGQLIKGGGIGSSESPTINTIESIIDENTFTVVEAPSTTESTASPLAGGLGKSSSQIGTHPNGVFLDLPDDFLYAIEEAATLQSNDVESWVKPIKHDFYLANINNPYKKPYSGLVWRMDISKQTQPEGTTSGTAKRTEVILPKGETLEIYRMRYLASPPEIVCDEFRPVNQKHCILDESIHGEIVKEAVIMGKAAVNPETYQIEVAEQQRND